MAVGDALVKVYGPPPAPGVIDGSRAKLAALAGELGVSLKWLVAARICAASWPARERRPSVGWPVHRWLAARADRYDVLADFTAHCSRLRVAPSLGRLRGWLDDPTIDEAAEPWRATASRVLIGPHLSADRHRSAWGKPEPNRGDRGSVSDCRRTQTRSPGIFGDCYRAVRTELESLRQRCRTARVPGCPMSGQRATSTCSSSNSNSGWLDTDSIIPPTRLRATTSRTITLVAASATSPATARTQNSSSAGPGRAWITQRGSRRRSHPFGDVGGIAASRRPPASIGQNGCTRGPPSRRTEARNAIENHDASAGSSSPRSSATIRPQPSGDVGHLARRSIELRPRRHHRSLLDS